MLSKGTAYALVLLAVSLVSASQLLIKSRFDALNVGSRQGYGLADTLLIVASDPRLWAAGCFMVLGALSWYAALSRLPLSFMIPIGAAVAPLVALGAHLWLGEQLSSAQMAAIIVIAAGIVWLSLLQT